MLLYLLLHSSHALFVLGAALTLFFSSLPFSFCHAVHLITSHFPFFVFYQKKWNLETFSSYTKINFCQQHHFQCHQFNGFLYEEGDFFEGMRWQLIVKQCWKQTSFRQTGKTHQVFQNNDLNIESHQTFDGLLRTILMCITCWHIFVI